MCWLVGQLTSCVDLQLQSMAKSMQVYTLKLIQISQCKILICTMTLQKKKKHWRAVFLYWIRSSLPFKKNTIYDRLSKNQHSLHLIMFIYLALFCLPSSLPQDPVALCLWLQIFHTTKVLTVDLRNCCTNEDKFIKAYD